MEAAGEELFDVEASEEEAEGVFPDADSVRTGDGGAGITVAEFVFFSHHQQINWNAFD